VAVLRIVNVPAILGVLPIFSRVHDDGSGAACSYRTAHERRRSAAVQEIQALVPVLLGFTSPNCAIPPVRVAKLADNRYVYRVLDGYHRFYASIAVGYSKLPVIVVDM
jgi:ParB-like nuclease domain